MNHRRVLLLLSLFFIVAIAGAAFMILYSIGANKILDQYKQSIASCAAITDADTCFANEKCEGIYAAGESGKTTFMSCQEVPQKFAAQDQQSKNLCIQTGGAWLRTKLGNFCECNEVGALLIFDQEQGCIKR